VDNVNENQNDTDQQNDLVSVSIFTGEEVISETIDAIHRTVDEMLDYADHLFEVREELLRREAAFLHYCFTGKFPE